MNRANAFVTKAFLPVIALGAAVVLGAPREAGAQYPYVAPPPPPAPAYVATTQPEYFEGRPVYFYNGNWYYQDEHGWKYYRHEPPVLRERREQWEHGDKDKDHDRRYHYRR